MSGAGRAVSSFRSLITPHPAAVVALILVAATVALAVGRDVAAASGSLVVDSTGDADARDGALTLREAILVATGDLLVSSLDAGEVDNVSGAPGAATADTVTFSAVTFPAGSAQEIALSSDLPWLKTGGDTVDGTGAGVVITSMSGTDDCLTLGTPPSGSTGDANVIRALVVHGCGKGIHITSEGNLIDGVVVYDNGIGIDLDDGARFTHIERSIVGTDAAGTPGIGNQTGINSFASSTVIGGPDPADGNVISGNVGSGIDADAGSHGLVQNNFVGTAADGETAVPNGGIGIRLSGENPNSWTFAGNVISGNGGGGIELQDSTGHVIRGNRIGVTMSGAPLGNGGDGILKSAARGPLTIGGSAVGDGNIIGANAGHGISIGLLGDRTPADIFGNYVGVTDDGSSVPNGLSGVYINAQRVKVGGVNAGEGNVIAGNGRYGVEFKSDPDVTDNFVRGNSIYANALGGILIPPATAQDVAAPVITAVGSASGTSCAGCTIDVYSDDGGQGRRYEGTTVSDGGGNWSFAGIVHGPYVTATASEYAPAPVSPRGTSEFSAPYPFDTDVDGVPDVDDACPSEDSSGFDADGDGCIDTIEGLGTLIDTLAGEGLIASPILRSLHAKIHAALASLDRDKVCTAINQLNALKHAIEAQAGKKVSEDASHDLLPYITNVQIAVRGSTRC